uniref:Uncharacterized protein n=1 Tax=Anopheles culicifacies TaxID=139723 RepID=A0A182MSN1_9DIPT
MEAILDMLNLHDSNLEMINAIATLITALLKYRLYGPLLLLLLLMLVWLVSSNEQVNGLLPSSVPFSLTIHSQIVPVTPSSVRSAIVTLMPKICIIPYPGVAQGQGDCKSHHRVQR